MTPVRVRPALPADLAAMAKMAAKLVAQHHAADARRFFLPDEVERGYQRWFGQELRSPTAVLRVAERGAEPVGYAYARLEERDWNALLDACGALHDLFVEESARGAGVGQALLDNVLAALTALGAPRVVLHTMTANHAAQRLFARAGFRTTMLEMTRELSEGLAPND
jgi:ribosomal protein S18 acetylase RimI-like enzyme